MAVQQNKKSPSKRGMHRAHDFLTRRRSRSSRSAARCICATTSARAATTAARRSSRPRPTSTPTPSQRALRPARSARAAPVRDPTLHRALDDFACRHGSRRRMGATTARRSRCRRRSQFLEATPDARVILVGLEAPLEAALAQARSPRARSRSSMHAAHRSRRRWTSRRPTRCAARRTRRCASRSTWSRTARRRPACRAGNTGALMAISRFVLKTLPGIDRPAIASQLPTQKGVTTVLDLGANVNCTPEQLVQFAVMGSALVAAVDGIERPTVGLLNIGEEDIKGNEVVKQAAELLQASRPQLLRQRRRRRHLQGHDRRRGLRRLRRQRRAEDLRRPGADALRVPARPSSRAIR